MYFNASLLQSVAYFVALATSLLQAADQSLLRPSSFGNLNYDTPTSPLHPSSIEHALWIFFIVGLSKTRQKSLTYRKTEMLNTLNERVEKGNYDLENSFTPCRIKIFTI